MFERVTVAAMVAMAMNGAGCEPVTGQGAPVSPHAEASTAGSLSGEPGGPNAGDTPPSGLDGGEAYDGGTPDQGLDGGTLDGGVDGGDGGIVTRVTMSGPGCDMDVARDPGRIGLSSMALVDPNGDATTMFTTCAVTHELRLPRGYAWPGGVFTADATAKLPDLGRGSVKVRVQVDDGEPASVLHPLVGAYDGAWTPTARMPHISACDGERIVRIETQVSATLRAERSNTEPRRLSVEALQFPAWRAVRCADAGVVELASPKAH